MMKQKKDYEKTAFLLLLSVMAVYYGWRMFFLTPWYDELYTYYYFISNGPVYAAIHWPLPNNHVGYSVLSGFLDYLGNPYIGLRGISYLCALANMTLLFIIGRKYLMKWMSITAVLFYISMNLVNQLAVQGRGYALGVTCFLTAFLCLTQVCESEKVKKKVYLIYALSLTLGLYAIPSNVYWVIPLCLAGGSFLLYAGITEARKKEQQEKTEKFMLTESGKRLARLIGASIGAALMTVFLYALIWLAIGSNLLIKNTEGPYTALSHGEMIFKEPLLSLRTGMEYMLATPYIQSVEREGFLPRLYQWFLTLFDYLYSKGGMMVFGVFLTGIVFLLWKLILIMKKQEKKQLLFILFLLTGLLLTPIFLLVQCTLPYYRVFVYLGVLIALLAGYLLQELLLAAAESLNSAKPAAKKTDVKNTKQGILAGILAAAVGAFALSQFVFGGYNNQYSMREAAIQDAWEQAGLTKETDLNLCVTDCTQQYMLNFLYGIKCENMLVENADVVLLDKKMTDPEYEEMEWEFYHYYHTLPWEYINNELAAVYENDDFVLYRKPEK